MNSATFKLNNQQLNEIKQLAHEHAGIIIQDYQTRNLERHIEKNSKELGYKSPEKYIDMLHGKSRHSIEYEKLMTAVTINASYFFRGKLQMDLLHDNILPKLIKQHRDTNNKTLRIWSAGCAAGQELYSLLIILSELLPDINDWKLTLLGTDINTTALAQAMEGFYYPISLRDLDLKYKKKYFTAEKSGYRIKTPLRNLAKFACLNLLNGDYPSPTTNTSSMDLILCRNVFIYFDANLIRKILERFSHTLLANGYLLTASIDMPRSLLRYFNQPENTDKSCYSRKELLAALTIKTNKVSEAPIKTQIKEPAKVPIKVPVKAINSSLKPKQAKSKKIEPPKPDYTSIKTAIANDDYQQALLNIEQQLKTHTKDAKLLQYKAKLFADLGDIDKALESCEQSLKISDIDPNSYFIKALILIERDEHNQEAIKALRQALFLDKDFVEAHYYLGLLLLNNKKHQQGLHSLKNALEKVAQQEKTAALRFSPNVKYSELNCVIQQEIELYTNGESK